MSVIAITRNQSSPINYGAQETSRCEGAWLKCLRWLLLQVDRRPADPFSGEIDGYLYTVSNFDERNATVHAVLLAVEGHYPFDSASTFLVAGNRKRELLLLGDSAYREVAPQAQLCWDQSVQPLLSER
jgi:hypothetical protein